MRVTKTIGRLAVAVTAVLLLVPAAQASASVGPKWRVDSLANSTAEPGGVQEFLVEIANVGDQPMDGSQVELIATLPAGMTALQGTLDTEFNGFLHRRRRLPHQRSG
jgi:uncharacterized repeat protein (TIGR01451 family)